jgi:hypothetical protein
MDWWQKENNLMDLHYCKAIRNDTYSLDSLKVYYAMLVKKPAPDLESNAGHELNSLARTFYNHSGGRPTIMRPPLWQATLDIISRWIASDVIVEDIDDEVQEIINFVNEQQSETQSCIIL